MKKFLAGWFDFNRTEQRGIAVLVIIIVMLILALILMPVLIRKDNHHNYSGFLKEAAEFMAYRDSADVIPENEDGFRDFVKNKIHPFPFDPNNLPEEKWKALGLEDWQIRIIKNFEKKGGRFRDKTDLSNIYGISGEEYEMLEPYIKIKDQPVKKGSEPAFPQDVSLFTFDPNQIDSSGARKLGLNEKTTQNLLHFRAKGGKFYKKEDFAKLYGLSPGAYNRLEPYILIRDSIPYKKQSKNSIVVELNTADTLDLQQIRGIGPGFARRIVNYRNKLGGYCRKEQLLEVYGMDSVRYRNMLPQISLDPGKIRKININNVTIKELIKHPYFEYYLAKSIITYRDKKKSIVKLEELKHVEFMYDDVYEKVAPYLTL